MAANTFFFTCWILTMSTSSIVAAGLMNSFSRAGTALYIFVSFTPFRELNQCAAFRSSEMRRTDHFKHTPSRIPFFLSFSRHVTLLIRLAQLVVGIRTMQSLSSILMLEY
jgi:hypothetical protein